MKGAHKQVLPAIKKLMHIPLNIEERDLYQLKRSLKYLNSEMLFQIMFALFSTVGCIIMLVSFDKESFIINWNNTLHTQGQITNVEETNYGIGNDLSSVSIYKNTFIYSAEGLTYEGVSYSTGRQVELSDNVNITFFIDNPEISKITNQRMSPFSLFALGIIFLPLLGIYFIRQGVIEGQRNYNILADGILTMSEKTIRTTINDEEGNKSYVFYRDLDEKKHRISTYINKEPSETTLEVIYQKSQPSEAMVYYPESKFGEIELKKLVTTAIANAD